ncbi:hypothetical protein EUGRSUZ_G01332 [Eucalyptus grandis]|uniref:Uncharacterized protein n=2 Tax=Eucalyptus grandis TaxID=71139 RepID=A0ACC3K2Q2_EUCGR|nr:hypothetical protein EUGRSUZ_G01332 [Eucalyptus grandis]
MRSHAVEYTVTNSAGNTTGGALFSGEIGIPYSRRTLTVSTHFIWRVFHQKAPEDRKSVEKVSLFIENMEGLVATYLGGFSGDVKREFTGILYHEMAHVWQWDGDRQAPEGPIRGIADFVRLRSVYVPGHWVGPGQGDRWDQDHGVTARFLDYCNGLRNGFVAELNKKIRTGYSDGYFVDLLGNSIDQLWKDYKAKYAT